MGKALSMDLRERAMARLAAGESVRQVALALDVAPPSVVTWSQRLRQPGQRPKSDTLAPKVLQAIEDGRSYRWIAQDLGISKNTVTDIVRRHRQTA